MSKEQDFTEEKMLLVKKALAKLDEEERQIIGELINRELSDERMDFLKNFILTFDPDSALDTCVCQIMTQVGQQIGITIMKDLDEGRKEGKTYYNGRQLLKVSIKVLQDVAQQMKNSVKKFEEEYKQH